MNKIDFVKAVAEAGNYKSDKRINRHEAERALNAVFGAIQSILSENRGVDVVGFGKFENVLQKGKTGKVPGSGKRYVTEDKYVPKFRPSKALKDMVASLVVE